MKALKASEFPELQRAFSGYLHEDFVEEHGTPAAALQAFQEDASPVENLRFRAEARRFLERIEKAELSDVRTLMARLGCRWSPRSRKALIALFADATKDTD
jgi:hypothetical protein